MCVFPNKHRILLLSAIILLKMVDAINAMSPEELKRITVEELGEDENKMKVRLVF